MELETLSLSGFAAKHGWHKSRSSQLKKEGRLILDATGKVLVAESEALLFSTTDPTKAGVAERHQRNRSQGLLNEALVASADEAGDITSNSSSQRRAAALADIAELDRDRQYGKVCDVEVVQAVLMENYTAIRQMAEQIPFEMKPLIALESFDLLQKKMRHLLETVSNTASTFADKLKNTEQ